MTLKTPCYNALFISVLISGVIHSWFSWSMVYSCQNALVSAKGLGDIADMPQAFRHDFRVKEAVYFL